MAEKEQADSVEQETMQDPPDTSWTQSASVRASQSEDRKSTDR
jgi:hypothetical protein